MTGRNVAIHPSTLISILTGSYHRRCRAILHIRRQVVGGASGSTARILLSFYSTNRGERESNETKRGKTTEAINKEPLLQSGLIKLFVGVRLEVPIWNGDSLITLLIHLIRIDQLSKQR